MSNTESYESPVQDTRCAAVKSDALVREGKHALLAGVRPAHGHAVRGVLGHFPSRKSPVGHFCSRKSPRKGPRKSPRLGILGIKGIPCPADWTESSRCTRIREVYYFAVDCLGDCHTVHVDGPRDGLAVISTMYLDIFGYRPLSFLWVEDSKKLLFNYLSLPSDSMNGLGA